MSSNNSQKDIFANGEGDNWFLRNQEQKLGDETRFFEIELLSNYLGEVLEPRYLEVGCSDGRQVFEFFHRLGGTAFGIDPSSKAIEKANLVAKQKGVDGNIHFTSGTANNLEFPDAYFHFLIFGFCLYLVDEHLLKGALLEGDRVLQPGGYLIIKDFDHPVTKKVIYKHDVRVFSYKRNYVEFYKSLDYALVAKLSTNDQHRIIFDRNPDKRIATWLMQKPVK